MVIDAHIHLYPEAVSRDPVSWAAERSESYWLNCVAPSRGPVLQGWASVKQLLKDMDDAGVEKAVILGWYWENPDTCLENMEWQIEWIRQHPDRLMAFAPFNAKGGPKALEGLQRGFDAGIAGIGELNPPAQGYVYVDAILDRALDLAGQRGKAVNFHVTDPASREYPGKIETPFSALFDLAKRHSKTKLIFAHLGGMMKLSKLRELKNVYLDTAATPLLYPDSVYKEAIAQMGANRILFGTDYPLRTFPRSQSSPDFSTHLDQLRQAGLEPEALERLLHQNTRELLDPIPSQQLSSKHDH